MTFLKPNFTLSCSKWSSQFSDTGAFSWRIFQFSLNLMTNHGVSGHSVQTTNGVIFIRPTLILCEAFGACSSTLNTGSDILLV